jgi:Dioxygenase
MDDNTRITRRGTLVKLAGLVATAAGGSAWVGSAAAGGTGPAGVASGAVACVLTPEQTEGPYYIAGEKLRRDITEGHAGTPLALRLAIVNASSCRLIRNATVDIWHCDAAGVYSGFGAGAANRTFLRGIQKTDAQGVARFKTIYPGWYQGRTVHVHVKVHLGGNVVHTGQLYFPDALTDRVFAAAPYSSRPNRSTRNAGDFVYAQGGKQSTLKLTQSGRGYVGAITLGVHAA